MTTLTRFFAGLTRARALGIVALLWAAIYLPALGSLEIKGEEGRRILPAVAMLDTGEWIVPQVGGVPYFSKPPLINWLIAGAFRLTGTRGEWAARLPSVAAVLVLGLATVWTLSRWLGVGGALLAAVFLLTNIGLMEKGRLAEIESLYLGLYGLALLCWLGNWRRDADLPAAARPAFPWRTWTLPWTFLGFGLLAKGPLHLVYFYAVIVAVLVCARRWRELFHPAHALGLLLMLGIFAAWAIPYLHEMDAGQATGKWYVQMAGRVEVGEKFSLSAWLLNGPRGLVNFLPWTVLLPLAWKIPPAFRVERDAIGTRRDLPDSQPTTDNRPLRIDLAIARGLRWALGSTFVVISLAPGGIPRYTLPLLVPASLLLALTFTHRHQPATGNQQPTTTTAPPSAPSLVWTRTVGLCLWLAILAAPLAAFFGGKGAGRVLAALAVAMAGAYLLWRLRPLRQFAELEPFAPTPGGVPRVLPLALASGAVMGLLTVDYAVGAVHRLHRNESVRPVGTAIRRAVPTGQTVAVLRPGFLPFLFYVKNLCYLQDPAAIPPGLHYLLVRQKDLPGTAAALNAQGIAHHTDLIAKDKRMRGDDQAVWLLLALNRPRERSL